MQDYTSRPCDCFNNVLLCKISLNIMYCCSFKVNTGNELHMPFGRPRVLQQNAKYCLLYHSQYINGYSQDFLMPLWSAYTVQKFVSYYNFTINFIKMVIHICTLNSVGVLFVKCIVIPNNHGTVILWITTI